MKLRTNDGYKNTKVVAQQATGSVRLRYENGEEDVVDLESEEYRWISGET